MQDLIRDFDEEKGAHLENFKKRKVELISEIKRFP